MRTPPCSPLVSEAAPPDAEKDATTEVAGDELSESTERY